MYSVVISPCLSAQQLVQPLPPEALGGGGVQIPVYQQVVGVGDNAVGGVEAHRLSGDRFDVRCLVLTAGDAVVHRNRPRGPADQGHHVLQAVQGEQFAADKGAGDSSPPEVQTAV